MQIACTVLLLQIVFLYCYYYGGSHYAQTAVSKNLLSGKKKCSVNNGSLLLDRTLNFGKQIMPKTFEVTVQ